jgi:hypothetical protein
MYPLLRKGGRAMKPKTKTLEELAEEYGIDIDTARRIDVYAKTIVDAMPPPDDAQRARLRQLFSDRD